MARFRSKPVEIEAVQLTAERFSDWLGYRESLPNGCDIEEFGRFGVEAYCTTRQGIVKAKEGDWIIQESDGSGCYPCKPDVFAAKYEPLT